MSIELKNLYQHRFKHCYVEVIISISPFSGINMHDDDDTMRDRRRPRYECVAVGGGARGGLFIVHACCRAGFG